MPTTLAPTRPKIKAAVRTAAREISNKIESDKPSRANMIPLQIPQKAYLKDSEVKCVSHLVCALILNEPELAMEAQSCLSSRMKVLELLA